ncbi:protein ENDOSPERM DEFECTIVE 1 isoform X2 [Punica granatum]|uniref:Protein ENDOSPERM DEFECTIVE 1 isoform X2 n=1 Tax=Punica granatum TaxID=22663 RepID=A0A6P8DI15_PUNGR|nr:protein ENDOSPERM DEFECTIVE 1 isoform X2 [Punica granatum]
MSGSTVENDATAQHPPEAAAAAAPLPPPPTQRRPRVREVRSRFMSPVVSSSSSGDLHLPTTKSPVPKHGTDTQPRQNQQHGRSTSAQRRRQLELEPLSRADENRPETTRSLDTPLAGPAKPTTGTSVHKRQPLPRSVKENGDPEAIPRISSRNLRPDTPTVSTSMDRIGSSRLRLTPHHHHNHSLQRSISAGATAAVKLLHATGMSMSFSSPSGKARGDGNLGQDSDSDADINSEKNSKSVQEMRSSMPEADMANRLLERTGNRTGMDSLRTSGSSPRSRPVSSPRSSSEHPMRASERVVNSLCKQLPTPINVGKVPLPPVPPCAKPGADAKKGRKVSSHQEDVHTLRLLHNHYLQWRFANAKAEVSMQAQRREAETPYLEEWSALEDDYLASVSEATQALLNASYQLPVGANVRADVREVKEALASAVKIMEAITIHVQSFTAKAEELEVFISELARVAGGERILVEGCGDLLHRTYFSQVEECSLRGQIIQQQQKAMIQCSE